MNQKVKKKSLKERVAKLLEEVNSTPKLLFYTGGTQMFMQDGKLREEPEYTLEHMIRRYLKGCDAYTELMRKMEEASKPYKREKMANGKLVTYIDYDEWEKQDSEGCWDYSMAENNSYNGLDMLQWEIDLKIAHIYARKGIEIPPKRKDE